MGGALVTVPAGSAPFAAPAEHYDRYMGRFTLSLAPAFVDFVGVRPGMRVLDVGCGPGGLTKELVARVGSLQVAAIDPAPQFVAACQARYTGADVREGVAESLPWPDDSFDAAAACLVLGFMNDPDAGLREMARVVRPGGTVAACMWDLAGGGMTMLQTFWDAVHTVDPEAPGERRLAGGADGDIAQRMTEAGLADVSAGSLLAQARYTGFDDFWEPLTYAVGPAGQYLRAQDADRKARIREACRATRPDGQFTLDAQAWCARGTIAAAS
jgi:SAM-dependent methyltransferase